ncbi:MAG TPA: hypothetical protein VK446_16995 [Methylocystis sp.]|nr:hypothetical protein [Methylocystis sp.]
MTAHAFPHGAGRSHSFSERLIDSLWYACLILVFGFVLAVGILFTFALALDVNLVKLPPQICHYMTGEPHLDRFCRAAVPGFE